MKTYFNHAILVLMLLSGLFLMPLKNAPAQSYAAWYQNAQERIDTLRKNDYGIQIFDKNGQPYTGEVSVRMTKHEYPFGVAFDLQQNSAVMGNTYSTNETVQAKTDAEIYRNERWAANLAYAIPVVRGKEYEVTLKFAEIFHGGNNARIFDVKVNGEIFLQNFDTHALAGGKDIAIDTSLTLVSHSGEILIELQATTDNVAIKGIVVEEVNGESIIRINCGGSALTTSDGNVYVSEVGFFNPDANTVASNDDWRKANMLKYFNAGVNENSFKWSGVQGNPGPPNYTNFDNALAWTQQVGWDYRAHTLLWGGNDHHSTPDWVRNLPTTQDIIDTLKMRVIRDVTRYRGVVKEYDVVNEPLTNHADWLWNQVGDSIIGESFKWARSADPDAELYINDYNVEYNWGQAVEYRDLINRMLDNGAPITGVGMQSHFWDNLRPNVNELVRNVNIVAETGLPIKFTEFDYGGNITQAQQAHDYIMVLTIAFSHPSVVGMYHWSLRDGWSWREGSGMFDSAGNPKLAADTLLYYTQTKWATNFDTLLQNNEAIMFNAYHGNYNIEVEFDGGVKVFSLPLLKANADSVFVLHEADAVLKGPELIEAELIENNKISLLFDKPIDASSIRRSNFKFFSPGDVGIQSVVLDDEDDNRMKVTLSRAVSIDNRLSISYFPGLLAATDGSVAEAFGPELIFAIEDEPDPDTDPDDDSDPSTDPDDDPDTDPDPDDDNDTDPDDDTDPNNLDYVVSNTVKVYPNPATDKVNVLFEAAPYTLNIYNNMGVLVHSEKSEKEIFSLDVASFSRGMYLIQVSDDKNRTYIQKVILK